MIDIHVILVRQAGDAGQLYGSVSARDISDALTGIGYIISRNQVRQASPIKNLGLHLVSISLHPEVMIEITANVARSVEEAAIQSETGMAILTQAETDAKQEAEEREDVFSAPMEDLAKKVEEPIAEAEEKISTET